MASTTVERGDTLARIARNEGVSLAALLKANPGISNPNLIRPGQKIRLPGRSGGLSSAEASAQLARVFSNPLPSELSTGTPGTQLATGGLIPVRQDIAGRPTRPLGTRRERGQRELTSPFLRSRPPMPVRQDISGRPTRRGPQINKAQYERLLEQGFSENYARSVASGTFLNLPPIGAGAPGAALGRFPSPLPFITGAPGAALLRRPATPPQIGAGAPGAALTRYPGSQLTTGTPGTALTRFTGEVIPLPSGVPGAALYRQLGIEAAPPPIGAGAPGAALARLAQITGAPTPTAGEIQPQPTAVGGRAPRAGAVARQESMALARAARSYAGNVQYAINSGDIRARPSVLSGEIAQTTVFRQMWEGLYASYEEFLADIGYRNLPGTDKWIREDPIAPSGGGLYGGGGGGRRVRYGGYGGGGGGRGETFGGDSLIQWRIRYTA